MIEEYISVKLMAKRLNISIDTAYTYVRKKGFPAYKVGRLIRISGTEKVDK